MWYLSVYSSLVLQLALSLAPSESVPYGPKALSFHLSPTALLHESHMHKEPLNAENDARVAAVYAGLDYIHDINVDGEDKNLEYHARRLVDEHNSKIDDFNLQRRYSRFERERMSRDERRLAFRQKADPIGANNTDEDDYYTDDEITMKGGTYNAFQTVPLSQGYGTHYAMAWIGTPQPQPQSLIVDTGSHRTAFPCLPCPNCGQQYHASAFFNVEESDSFRYLRCGECQGDAKCDDGECLVSQSYSEGSSWHAYQAKDMFFCGNNHPEELVMTAEEYYTDDDRRNVKQIEMDVQDERTDFNGKKFYDLDELDTDYGFPFYFGCQSSVTGLFRTQLADGIMGMSAVEDILSNQMYKRGLIEHNMFSMCYRRQAMRSDRNRVGGDKVSLTAGILTLGGVDRRIERSPMVYAKDIRKSKDSDWYTVQVKKLLLKEGGGQHAKVSTQDLDKVVVITNDEKTLNSGKGVIVDSGTTDSYFNRAHATAFKKAWESMTGKRYSNSAMKFTQEEVLQLPTLLVVMEAIEEGDDKQRWEDPDDVVGLAGRISPHSPGDILLAIPATHYMEFSPSNKMYTPRLYFTESSGGLLGANAMMNHDVLFDWSGRIGFSESDCDYDELMEEVDFMDGIDVNEDGDGTSKDCVIGPAGISVDCTESLDFAKCVEKDDPDYLMKGIVKWSMVIEAEGFGDGEKCTTVASDRFVHEKSIRSTCNDNGVCEVTTTCSMTCKDFMNKVKAGAEDQESKDEGSTNAGSEESKTNNIAQSTTSNSETFISDNDDCPNFGWGSCLYSCEQSKITSHLLEDGQCYVDKVETRSCHIDACGRSDPCRVPFIVHAIILFSGSDPTLWTKNDEERFAEGFADAVNKERSAGEELFGPGDVKVISVGSWKNEDNFFEGEESLLGMQLAVEISMYNENAILPGESEDHKEKNSTNGFVEKGKGILSAITGPGLSTCKESDVYQLSKQAMKVHVELGKGLFMYDLIESIREKESNHLRDSVFGPLFDDDESAENSSVLTSWTIKTEVGGFFQDGNFQGVNKERLKHSVPTIVVIISILLAFCYCGVCCGSFFTRRRYELLRATRHLEERIRQKKENEEKGEYSQVGVAQGDTDKAEDSNSNFVDDGFQDNPVEDFEDIDTPDFSEKMERLT